MSAPPVRRAALAGASAAIVALVFAAFLPALSAGFQEHWDDNFNVTQNGHFRGLSPSHLWWMLTTDRLGHWQPLSWLSLAIDHAIFGLDPFGYHLTNLILHATSSVLFFFVCRALLRAAGSRAAERIWPSLAGALVFAIHPLRVESVAWVTERRDVLAGVLLLASTLAWLAWCRDGGARLYLLALLAFALSLCAKAWGITFWAVLLVLDAWPLLRLHAPEPGARRRLLARRALEKLPFLALAAGAAVLAFRAQQSSGAMHYAEDFSALQKAAQACYGLCFYVLKSLWPADPLPVYSLDRELDPLQPVFLAAIAAVALAAVGLWLARRRAPWLVAAVLVYALVVAPVLGLTQSGLQIVAERYTYLATMPFAVLFAALLGRAPAGGARTAAAIGAALVLALCGARTHAYTKVWKDSRALFEHTAERRPSEWFAWTQLGTIAFQDAAALERAGDADGARAAYDRSLAHYDRAIAIEPRAHLAFENRGNVHQKFGRMAAAVLDWDRAIELNPLCPIPLVNRGAARFQSGDLAGARADFLAALDVHEDAGTWYMLGSTYAKLNRRDDARSALARCLELASPESPLKAQAERFLAELGG